MPQKAIREFDGKRLLAGWLAANSDFKLDGFASISPDTNLKDLPRTHPWLLQSKLVAKPDQLIKRRGKAGLIKLNATWPEASQWIAGLMGKEVKVEEVSGPLDHFLVERFVPHKPEDEYYFCIASRRDGDDILFYHQGGVDVGDVDEKAVRLLVPIGESPTEEAITAALLKQVPKSRHAVLARFLQKTFEFYAIHNFAYLEVNPLVMTSDSVLVPLDMAAKIDETARFECGKLWGNVEFPAPFGRPLTPEESYIQELDAATGASLKLTILNPKGRIWCMVAGGGASVIYADTLTDLGAGNEIANYGEYSGAPSESTTYNYAKTILKLMLKEKHEQGKILLIGGGIANFTNVADTFKGIIRAIREVADTLRAHQVRIFVRRGGPNYQEGLNMMRQLSVDLDIPMVVHGPDRHMTAIVSLALGKQLSESDFTDIGSPPDSPTVVPVGLKRVSSASVLKLEEKSRPAPVNTGAKAAAPQTNGKTEQPEDSVDDWESRNDEDGLDIKDILFTKETQAFVYGMQPQAVQSMLDFDYICKRKKPSVVGMIYPFSGNSFEKFYWNTEEILIPIYEKIEDAMAKFPLVDVVVNFASFRSVYDSTMDILRFPQIRTIAIIAEGVPERRTRIINRAAREKGVTIIGPATVGGLKAGVFRIGNTGGMLDNVLASKLYRPGSVAYVARSGGMSNELNNIISRNSDGVYEGIAIGGDMYPGSTFIDHIMRFQRNPAVKMIVLLGEVGGVEEYIVCEGLKNRTITKPLVAWCIGTCAKIFPYEVQFGHAGACASGKSQTADTKNRALKLAGAVVPHSFQDFGTAIRNTYQRLVRDNVISIRPEVDPPQIPVDYAWARKLGLIRKPSNFVSSISDERGDELKYAGMSISEIFASNLGVGGTVGLLWFRKRLPEYFTRFIEMVLVVTADHGPAVSGAHNTIVCARAGKDLVSSLVSGLLTIGPRFGGALDEAAESFAHAYDSGMSPEEYVTHMRKQNQLIMGIGHKVKSLDNPDGRVVIIKNYVKKHFKSTEVFDFACAVEKVTTQKRSNLILNVDGAIACAFVDLLRSSGVFTLEEARRYIEMGTLNGLFVLGRSIGFIGHYLDQNRLKQGLYRHPTEDISYIMHDNLKM